MRPRIQKLKPDDMKPPRRRMPEMKFDELEKHQALDCSHRDDCLMRAAKRGWLAFSCQNCAVYEHVVVALHEPGVPSSAGFVQDYASKNQRWGFLDIHRTPKNRASGKLEEEGK